VAGHDPEARRKVELFICRPTLISTAEIFSIAVELASSRLVVA
jgi:hypothetical protein